MFFGLNIFSRPNGRLSPLACQTYLESLCISGQFKLSGNHISASESSESSEFCWQIGLNLLQHLRPCHVQLKKAAQSQFCCQAIFPTSLQNNFAAVTRSILAIIDLGCVIQMFSWNLRNSFSLNYFQSLEPFWPLFH